MRQKLFWIDWAVCFLWTLVVLAECSWWALTTHFLMLVMVMMRTVLSFSLYRREKRSWVPLTVFIALFALQTVVGPVMITIDKITALPFVVLGINHDHLTHNITKCVLSAWLVLGPLVVYSVGLCRKTMVASDVTWKDVLGAILWKDKGAKVYGQLMLVAACALHVGLAMDMCMCRFACIVLPPISLYLLARQVPSCRGASEGSPLVGKLWVMVAAMVLFFFAQRYAGMWRVWMLVASIVMVAYVCWRTFGKQGLAGISILATVYLGMLLPTLVIGYNQYVCIDYGRRGGYTLESFRGMFYIEDSKTERVGLRDRYGLLVEPVYENIVRNVRNRPFGVYELRKNGCYTLYNVYRSKMMTTNVSDMPLQDKICKLLDEHFDSYGYGYRERLEVRVVRSDNAEVPLSHVKMTRYGNHSYYDYSDSPYISEDSVALRSGEFATGSVVLRGDTFHVLHYSHDVKQGSEVLYTIDVKTARRDVTEQDALVELAKGIVALL